MNTTTATHAIQLPIGGMTCASCVARVEKALKAVPGVESASVNLATEQATVQAGSQVSAETLAAAVRKAGYDVASAETTLQIEGMTCASCVARVEKALLKVPGVTGAVVNLATERATVQALATVPAAALKAAIEKAGYAASGVATPMLPFTGLPAWWPVAKILNLLPAGWLYRLRKTSDWQIQMPYYWQMHVLMHLRR